MCGIVGICFTNNSEHLLALPRMRDALTHRGPDSEGIWFDYEAGTGFGHRRLSIIDLSQHGHQPMLSASGRYVIVFNGEIYNFKELKKQLEQEHQIVFQGHSDTEIFLAGIEAWGIDKTLAASVGMFAIALWDRQERALYLVRDRFGEKPLYYGWIDNALIFASELKSFYRFPRFKLEINKKILPTYLRYSYIPAPYSIDKKIFKIIPGQYLKISDRDKVEEKIYWSAKKIAEQGIASQAKFSYTEATVELEKRLQAAIALQMRADVPVGAFLSGGIDSSLIVTLMQAQSKNKVNTFSIGFHEKAFNEAHYAKEVAKHLGTDHTELYVTAKNCQDVIALLPHFYDEPFADSSQIPTYLVSKLAKEKVKVSLSGDGGDELFGGYQRYFYAENLWNIFKFFPYPIRHLLGKCSLSLHNKFPQTLRNRGLIDKLNKYLKLFSRAKEKYDVYFPLMSLESELWMAGSAIEPSIPLTNRAEWLITSNFPEWMMFLDSVSYLPDDLLVKIDRASMAVSLESRVPFLDHRVFELTWQLPIQYKMQAGQGKRILRDILYRYVPKKLIDRPKHGFGIPLGSWLRGPLRAQFEEMLQEKSLTEYWNMQNLKKCWEIAKLNGNAQYDSVFWSVFVFYKWLGSVLSNQPRSLEQHSFEIALTD